MSIKLHSAIKKDLFAADQRREKTGRQGDPLLAFEEHIDFVALAKEVNRLAKNTPIFIQIVEGLRI